MIEYRGQRHPRLVRAHRGGLLDEARHHLLAAWAADCAEHVLPLFAAQYPDDERPLRAIDIARAWTRGEAAVGEARAAAVAAHAAARSVSHPVAREVARAAGHAAATAHMADHGTAAAMYAIRAVRTGEAEHERRWQRRQLPDAIRELVLSEQQDMEITTANTIIYGARFPETVDFYKARLGLPVTAEFDWFVEFELNEGSRLSIADEGRASIKSSAGQGLTITLQVEDIEWTHSFLEEAGIDPTEITDHAWGARVMHAFDPEGTRIEFWQPS